MPHVFNRRQPASIPAGAVYVGRGKGGRVETWSNPYVMHGERQRDAVCDNFEVYARERLQREPDWLLPLVGKDLVCWCQSPQDAVKKRCHAQIILQLIEEMYG